MRAKLRSKVLGAIHETMQALHQLGGPICGIEPASV